MWAQFVVSVQSDAEGVVVENETIITTRIDSVTRNEHGFEISLARFAPPIVEESDFLDAYLAVSARDTSTSRLLLTCGNCSGSRFYQLSIQSIRYFEALCPERFAKLLE